MKLSSRTINRLALVVLLMTFLGISQKSEAAGSPISVKPILPENQLKNDNTYFDILVGPNQEQDLKLEIRNSSDKEEEVEVSVNTALTSDGGSIDYSRPLTEDNRDNSMVYAMEEMVKVAEPKVRIPAKETIYLNLHVKSPGKVVDGVLIGAVTVKYVSQEKEKQESQMSVVNNLAFTTTIKLTMSKTPVEADLLYQRTYAAQTAGRNQVNVMLQNPKQALLNKMVYHAQIYKKGESTVLHESRAQNYRVAPTSKFNFPVSWEGKAFSAGDYEMKLSAKSEETGQEWKFSEDFKITAEEARHLNESAVDVEVNYLLYYIIGTVVALFLILLLIFIIVKHKKQKKQAELERLRRKKQSRRKKSSKKKASRGER